MFEMTVAPCHASRLSGSLGFDGMEPIRAKGWHLGERKEARHERQVVDAHKELRSIELKDREGG